MYFFLRLFLISFFLLIFDDMYPMERISGFTENKKISLKKRDNTPPAASVVGTKPPFGSKQNVVEQFKGKYIDVEIKQLSPFPYIKKFQEQIGTVENQKLTIKIPVMVAFCCDKLGGHKLFKKEFNSLQENLTKEFSTEKVNAQDILRKIEETLQSYAFIETYGNSFSVFQMAARITHLDDALKEVTGTQLEMPSELIQLRSEAVAFNEEKKRLENENKKLNNNLKETQNKAKNLEDLLNVKRQKLNDKDQELSLMEGRFKEREADLIHTQEKQFNEENNRLLQSHSEKVDGLNRQIQDLKAQLKVLNKNPEKTEKNLKICTIISTISKSSPTISICFFMAGILVIYMNHSKNIKPLV